MLIKLDKNLLPLFLIAGGLIIAGVLVLFVPQLRLDIKKTSDVVPLQKAAESALNFINKNILAGQQTSATLISYAEEKGLYKLRLSIQGQEFDSYITKDGKIFFPEAVNLEEKTDNIASSQNEPSQKSCQDLAKQAKASMDAFIVSRCPYGLQMQRILAEVVKNIPSLKENVKVRYIGSIENGKIISMHGDAEAQENLRQICIREETSKYWDYISCYIQKGESQGCISKASIDSAKINSCINDANRGLKYAQQDFVLQNQYAVSGSPSLAMNGEQVSEFWFGGRNAQALKTLLCCGFSQQPSLCSKNLTTDQAATSFSVDYSSGESSSGTGGCGE